MDEKMPASGPTSLSGAKGSSSPSYSGQEQLQLEMSEPLNGEHQETRCERCFVETKITSGVLASCVKDRVEY